MVIKKFNRVKKKRSPRIKIWCGYCDAYKVGINEKCKVCGQTYKDGTHKKSPDIEI